MPVIDKLCYRIGNRPGRGYNATYGACFRPGGHITPDCCTCFQLGDGFSNSVLPMSSSLMGYLAVSKIPYSKWLKFMLPLFGIWTALGCLFMLGALMIGY